MILLCPLETCKVYVFKRLDFVRDPFVVEAFFYGMISSEKFISMGGLFLWELREVYACEKEIKRFRTIVNLEVFTA